MHTWRVLIPHRSLHYLYKVIGCFVPRSGSSFLIPDPHSSFRMLVPHSRYNFRFITPSPPLEKDALPNPYITRNRELSTLARAIQALPYGIINSTFNSGVARKKPKKSFPCAGDRPWSAWYGRPSCPVCFSFMLYPYIIDRLAQ